MGKNVVGVKKIDDRIIFVEVIVGNNTMNIIIAYACTSSRGKITS